MNLTFLRNVAGIFFLVAFVCDLVFGNGVESWWDWLAGAILVNAIYNLASTFRQYRGTRKLYRFDEKFVSDVLDMLIVLLLTIRIIFGSALNWREFFVGASFAFFVRSLVSTLTTRR